MKKKVIAGVLIIGSALTLNAIATQIEYGAELKNEPVGEVKTAEEIITESGTKVLEPPEIVRQAVEETPDYITEIANSYGLDVNIVKAVIEIESGGDATAVGDDGYSVGLMQIQERYHKERMSRLGVTDLTHPAQNILVGCDLLAELLQEYGNYEMALSAYNSGDPCGALEYAERILKEAGK